MCLVVHQFYKAEILTEYVIRGNTAILKCNIPSFVADFVVVESWLTDSGEILKPGEQPYGTLTGRHLSVSFRWWKWFTTKALLYRNFSSNIPVFLYNFEGRIFHLLCSTFRR